MVAALAVLAAACGTTGIGQGPIVSPPPPDSTPSASVSPTPTGSPLPESPLVSGVATLALSGDLTLAVTLPTLGTPSVWAPPPAPMDLRWEGSAGQGLGLTGTSFLSRAETSPDRTLSFTVDGSAGAVEFSSSAGQCSVTITPALLDNMGGLFTCTALTDAEGTVTVDARGTFSATG